MIQVNSIPIFVEDIFYFELPNFKEYQKQIKKIISDEDSDFDKECNIKAQRTGWNSHAKYPVIKKVTEDIMNIIESFVKDTGYDVPKLEVEEAWVNWYGKDQHALPHKHNAVLSAVLFIDVEDSNGKFYFHADKNFVLTKKEDSNTNYSNIRELTATNGTVVFFDGNIMHSVSPNLTDNTRITLAMNFLPTYWGKRDDY
jgi:uncharacterized protein (TIGR02466 family)